MSRTKDAINRQKKLNPKRFVCYRCKKKKSIDFKSLGWNRIEGFRHKHNYCIDCVS